MEKLKCPMCDTSDFKDENGYYVCQICGYQISKETPKSAENESTLKGKKDKKKKNPTSGIRLAAMLIFAYTFYLALSSILAVDISYLPSLYLIGHLLCLASSLLMFIHCWLKNRGKKGIGKGSKTLCFIMYAVGRVLSLLPMLMNGYFNASTIFSAAIFIVLFWLASYKLDKDEKKETEATA